MHTVSIMIAIFIYSMSDDCALVSVRSLSFERHTNNVCQVSGSSI